MTSLQTVIKYLAIAFAVFLCVSIIVGIVTGLASLSYLISSKNKEPAAEMQTYPIESEISSLSVDLSAAEFEIKISDKFSVESNHSYISVSSKNGRLSISETKRPFGFVTKGINVILNIPEGFVFDEAEIDTGAGRVEIDALSANVLELSLGAGESKIKNLTANSRADIDGGAGALTIYGGLLRNLELDMGVGKLTLKSRLEGNCSLDYGVGETDLTLIGSREDYMIKIDKGIGEAKLEGESMNDDSTYGAGSNRIDIDGGVGAINIKFSDDESQNGDS